MGAAQGQMIENSQRTYIDFMSEHAETSFLFIFVSNNHGYRKRKILQDLKSSRVGSKCISSCCESMTHQTTSTAHGKCWRRKNRFRDVCLGVLRTSSPFNLSSQNILHLTMQLML